MIQQTSQLSLLDTIKEGKVNKRQQQVLDFFNYTTYSPTINDKPYWNNREISYQLGLPINTITARVNELVKAGKLVEHKKMKDSVTNRLVIYWKLK